MSADDDGRTSAGGSRSGRLLERSVTLTERRRRLERALVALPPVAAAVAASVLGPVPLALVALVAMAGLGWMLRGARREDDAGEAARRIDRALGAKDSFLTLATVATSARSVLWPAVEAEASARAGDVPARRFAPPLAWRPALASLAVSLAILAGVLLAPAARRMLPQAPLAELGTIAGELSAGGRDGASRKLGADLRELVAKLEDPSISAEEKRKLIAEMRAKLEESKGEGSGSGKGAGESAEGKDAGSSQGAEGKSGEASGASSSSELRDAAKSALDRAEKELEGKGQEKSESQPGDAGESEPGEGAKGEKKSAAAAGGGVQGPRSGDKAGDKPSDAPGNQPANQEQKGKSENGEGSSGRESRERPPDQNGESGGQSKGASGDGAGAADKPAPSEDGEEAERYYTLGDGPALELRDGAYVRVLVPESDDGVGVDRVQKPGVTQIDTPFGNAPLPSEGPTGTAQHSQRLPLEYRPALRSE